jgi:ribosomal protein S18 acetylase RimI-like enzyme
MAIAIREARPGEEGAVRELLAATWHDAHDAVLGRDRVNEITSMWHAPERLADQIADPVILFLVAADEDGRLVGHAMARLDEDGGLHLIRLYVRPGCQGSGLGSRLLAAAVEAFPQARFLRLEVQAHSHDAIRFYERHGLRQVATTEEMGGYTNVPALVMEKPLRG